MPMSFPIARGMPQEPTRSAPGPWDEMYVGLTEPEPYANTPTYELGARWLAPCDRIEDWGCGACWLKTLLPADRQAGYVGIDQAASPWADVVADLTEYRSTTSGLFMRHVLEHNRDWQLVLDNALDSFTRRMFLVVFTPLADHTHPHEVDEDTGSFALSFFLGDMALHFHRAGVEWDYERLETEAHYGEETVFRISKGE